MTGTSDENVGFEDQDADAPTTAPGGPKGTGNEDRSQETPLGEGEAGGSGSGDG